MNTLKAGFARIDITPMLGIPLAGAFELRPASEIMDPLEATALAVSDGKTTALFVSLDVLQVPRILAKDLQQAIMEATGVPVECIYLHGTHTHSGPFVYKENPHPLVQEHLRTLTHKAADACVMAIKDLKPAKMGWAVGKESRVAFIRRFRMKDGSAMCNPGIHNPEIEGYIGKIDDRVNILRFDRGEDDSLVLVNFGNHPCVVGGTGISADWPGFMRRTVEAALPGCKCVFFNGCEGDVNHINVFLKDTDRPLTYDQDEKFKKQRYDYTRYIGRVMAGTVLQEFDRVKYVDVDSVRCLQRTVQIPNNIPDPSEVPAAKKLVERLEAGEVDALHAEYPGMMFETVMGNARRITKMENGPAYEEMEITAIALGNVAFVGYPGEPFSEVGFRTKNTEGWELILPTACTNGGQGYFPMEYDYKDATYEAVASRFKPGAAELLISNAKEMLEQLKA